MAITVWFVVLVAIGAIPLVVIGQWWVVPAWLALCVLLGILDLILAGSPRKLAFARELPPRVRLGETVQTRLTVTNAGRRRVRGLLRDAWQPSAGAAPTRRGVDIPSGERRAFSTRLTPTRRGARTAEHVTVRSVGPLRLAARQATMRVQGRILVLPPFTSRKYLPSRLARLRELEGRTSVMIRGQGTEFDSLREYVRGDDVRSLDWRATARRRDPATGSVKLVVRTWRPERDRRVVVVIDSGRTSAARIADEPRLDTSYEATLLLSALASRAGDRVDALIWDRRVRGRVQGATGAQLLSKLVDAMAPVEAELIEPDWSVVPALVREVTAQHALVVVLTAIDSPGSTRSLLAMLPQLTHRHTVVVAAVRDPSVASAAAIRGTGEEVYRAAAAERALLDSARVEAAIRQLGADVVTATPQELPPALADRYIALKAAGRL